MMDLKSWRIARNLNQQELAELIGTNAANVSRIETGNQWPGPKLMTKIEQATAGEVSASDLLRNYVEKCGANEQTQAAE